MTMEELGGMTPRNFQNKLDGYNQRVMNKLLFERQMAYLQLKSWGAKIKPHELWPLEIDERLGEKSDIPTREETEQVIKEFKRVNPKLFRPRGK